MFYTSRTAPTLSLAVQDRPGTPLAFGFRVEILAGEKAGGAQLRPASGIRSVAFTLHCAVFFPLHCSCGCFRRARNPSPVVRALAVPGVRAGRLGEQPRSVQVGFKKWKRKKVYELSLNRRFYEAKVLTDLSGHWRPGVVGVGGAGEIFGKAGWL